MLGKMQDWPLLVSRLIDHAALAHAGREIVTLRVEGDIHRYTWADCQVRSKKMAQALEAMGVQKGDRVATLAWNTYRHVETWYGISGMGAVAHTINPRLFGEQIAYIANHAQDKVLFFDLTFLPIIEALAAHLKTVEHFVLMIDRAKMPESSPVKLICYEDLIDGQDGDYEWPLLDENSAAGLCYTSGTTGNPKGALYSHRSNVLHTFAALSADALGMQQSTVILPVVPMFHANAWGVPYAAAAAGCKLVLNGPNFDPPTLHKAIIDEGVTATAAVPTVWLGMLQYLRKSGKDMGNLKSVTIGGSAAPRMMIEAFQKEYGVSVQHAWGMTEMSPLGTVGSLTADALGMSMDEQIDLKCKQGRAIFGVEMKIVDEDGKTLPRDGKAFGHLMVRGPWIVSGYMGDEGGNVLDENGFFDTGDIATIDPHGYMQITDRSKDVIKSGGEWISSIDLENAAMSHPDVAEAAVIGIFHPKWDERPLLIVVPEEGASLDKDQVLAFLQPQIAKWWMPDDVVFVKELPHTATGKLQKTTLREQFKDYTLPTVNA